VSWDCVPSTTKGVPLTGLVEVFCAVDNFCHWFLHSYEAQRMMMG
jgi:hypothetical protein